MTRGGDEGHGRIKVLLVDDDAGVRAALSDYLGEELDLAVVGECEHGGQVVEAAARLRPDVVVMDLHMPVLDGVAATRALRAAQPDVPVVILSAAGADVRPAVLDAGARCLVTKGAPAPLLHCIRSVAGDGAAARI